MPVINGSMQGNFVLPVNEQTSAAGRLKIYNVSLGGGTLTIVGNGTLYTSNLNNSAVIEIPFTNIISFSLPAGGSLDFSYINPED